MTVAHYLIPSFWIAWLVYWWVSAANVKETRWREPFGQAVAYRLPLIVAVILLLGGVRRVPWLNERWIAPTMAAEAIAAVVVAAGLAFAIRARRYLGTNWSAAVTVKVDHTLVRTGPYRLARHPIYTGILLALAGTALSIGEWRGVLALLLALISFKYKSLLEERKMQELFPEYEDYRKHTAALIPMLF